MIEYSDFQCPYSAQIHHSLRELAEEGKIKWAYRNYPLSSIHPVAAQAAEAAECAGEQGKFWAYTDALFDNQHELAVEAPQDAFLLRSADFIGLDQERLRKRLSAHQFERRVRFQMAEGHSKRIDATPTLFVNVKRRVGSLTLDQLEQLVQSQLR